MNGRDGQWGSSDASGGYGRLVRPFTLTGGRTQPTRNDFSLITLITTVEPTRPVGYALQPEQHRILRLCVRPIAVAEIAAYLDIPVSVTTIMLSDLLEAGRINARPPIQSHNEPEIALLQKVRDGLARL
jgi:hypothetical protein